MKGSDLKCDCGAGARDVALDMELVLMNSAVSWHCTNGHLMISGSRPGHDGFQQERFPEPKVMGVVDELDEETAAVPMSTDGARHVTAAELRERAVLAANAARAGEFAVDDETVEMWKAAPEYQPMSLTPSDPGTSTGYSFRPEKFAGPEMVEALERAVAEGRATKTEYTIPPELDARALLDKCVKKMEAQMFDTCPAATRVKRNGFNHTIRCQKELGHEGGHEAKADTRTTIWYGDATAQLQTNERYRFGLNPHWMMEKPGRKTMAGDFDNDE